MSTADTWVKYEEHAGEVLVYCALCGRKSTKRIFRASSLNHAEMHRLATAYHSTHRTSDMHAAALQAFHGELPERTEREELLDRIFPETAPTEQWLRRQAAVAAACRAEKGNA